MSNKKILFIFPQTGVQNIKPQAPLSFLTICPGLEGAGFEPLIIDTRVEENFKDKIKSHLQDSLFVGLTTMTGHQIHYALELAKFIRQTDPNIKIVWGGIHPSLLAEESIANPCIDIIVKGEGEEAVIELATALAESADLRKIKGLCYKDDSGQMVITEPRPLLDLETVKTPSWHLIDVSKYSEIGVQAGRGCPWRCRFCYNIQYNERRWRSKSVDQIMEELWLLKKKFKVEQVTFYDDNFFSNKKRAGELAQRMVDEGIKIKWSTTCRANYLANWDDAYWELMKASGVHILFVGSESGSEKILEYIKKDITREHILGMARTTRKHGLRVHTSFMIGFPVEDADDRAQTFEIMDRIKEIDPKIYITTTCIYTPYPGNKMYEDAQEHGFKPPESLEGWSRFSFFECQLPWISNMDRRIFEDLAFITRFVFWHREIKERYLKSYYYPFYYFLRGSALLRWKLRWFGFALEWKVFRTFVKRFMD